MIVLFNCGGRTGNQLFQISHAISSRRPGEWLLSVGFEATRALLVSPLKKKWFNIEAEFLQRIVGKFIYPLVYHALVRTGVASAHYERNFRCVVRKGKLRRLTIMRGEFESFLWQARDLAEHFRLKPSVLGRVRPIIESVPSGKSPVFLHIRRSDFRSLSIALPDSYYLNAIRMFRDRHPESFFFIVGDDPEHASAIFRDVDQKEISRMSALEDLALMASCRGGILSNSTFAWWGAFFSRGPLGYFAPRYWSGWTRQEWRPPEIRADFMTDLIDVADVQAGNKELVIAT